MNKETTEKNEAIGTLDILKYIAQFDKYIFTLIVFAVTYAFIFQYLDISLVFKNTTVAGGDTGSHVYIPYYLQEIFPRIKWWSPDWYSGFPFLYFYPPLMYVLSVILGFVIPLNIAFKTIIFAIILLFPVAFFLTIKWLGLKYPIPQLAMLFSLFLIFLESYTIYGGNLASLLAGQFSHTVSIALLFMFVGLMYKGINEKKYLVLNILLGASVILTHPVSGILLILISPFFLLQGKNLFKNLVYVAEAYLGIFLLSAFWTLGLVYYNGYTGTMKWTSEIKMEYVFPSHWIILNISACLGLLIAVLKKEKKLIVLLMLTVISLLAYFGLNNTNVWNTRFLPYISFSILLFAAYFIGSIVSFARKKSKIIAYILLFVIVCFSLTVVREYTTFTPSWFKWNFEGYQAKPFWSELENLFADIKELPQGRVMWEYHPDYDKYGTPRVLETLTNYTGHPTYEGLLIESGLTGPFHFINQTETSEHPTAAIAGFTYPPYNFDKGIKHLQMSGAKYFIAYSDKIKAAANNNSDLVKIAEDEPFFLYEIKNSNLVDSISSFSIEQKDKDWQKRAISWYKSTSIDTPIVYVRNDKEIEELEDLVGKTNSTNAISNINYGSDYVEFDTEEINVPVIVKISYFPTWKAVGAKGPYLVSPSYMMVVPTENHVRLYFSYGWVDWIGFALTFIGIVYLFNLKRINLVIEKRFFPKPTRSK